MQRLHALLIKLPAIALVVLVLVGQSADVRFAVLDGRVVLAKKSVTRSSLAA